MDFNLDDSQKKLARQIAETCRERLPERPTAHFSPEQWAVCGEAGLLGLSIPRDYGGQGLGALSTAVAMHALMYSSPTPPPSRNTVRWASPGSWWRASARALWSASRCARSACAAVLPAK